MGYQQQGYQQNFQGFQQPHQMPPPQPGADQFGAPHVPTMPVGNMQFPPPGTAPGSVVMVYGLNNQRMNCDLLFNLFCSYGNVLKVKFLLNKPGTAMVHMDSAQSAKNAIQYLAKCMLFGSELELAISKHDFIADHGSAGLLPDGSPCWKDFSRSRNNRFVTVEGTSKNRVIGPTAILHFYNAPPDAKEETLRDVFAQTSAVPPAQIKFFSQGGKSATGLMQWPSVEVGLESFVLANHYTIQSGGRAYTFKLAFSPAPSID
jgi:heterogeneous nuclear ribonucleoprotein L